MSKCKENSSDLDCLINNKSFKIKPIILEVPNYTYYHSAISDKDEDCNDRFVGRKKIIDKIRSFIFESTQNTGTYLVSGFRGMGKTSVVNRALSILNPKSKFVNYFYVWLILLPTIFIHHDEFIKFKYIFLGISLAFIIIYVIIAYNYSTRYKSNNAIKKTILFGFFNYLWSREFKKDLFIPQYQREKYVFIRYYRYFLICFYAFLVILLLHHIFEFEQNYYSHKFWLLTVFVLLTYLFFDISKDIFETFDIKSYFSWFSILFYIPFLVLIISLFFKESIFFQSIQWIASITFIFSLVIKFNFKLNEVKNNNNKYQTVFSRVLSFVNFNKFIVVKINLGKDQLTEKDVLKYITNEIYNKYNSWYFGAKNFKRAINVITIVLLLLMLLNGLFSLIASKYSYQQINFTYSVSKFFPSQALLSYKRNQNINLTDIKLIKLYSNNPKEISEVFNDTMIFKYSISNSVGYKSLIIKEKKKIKNNTVFYTQSLYNSVIVNVGKVANTLDYLFFKSYMRLRNIAFGVFIYNQNRQGGAKNNIANQMLSFFFPEVPSFIVFFTLFSILFLFRYLPVRIIPFSSHLSSLRQLKHLQNQIDASITLDKSTDANLSKTSLFSFKRSLSFKPLEAKDITQRLIHIFNNVDKVNPFFTKIRFILVFDELDKISSHYNEAISDKEDEYNVKDEIRFQARRKERIFNILSGMKHFLNTAKIKSIFIAGREMYDAALAGISDRESNLDSIFNDNKIYVNSFYTEGEDNNLTDITSMTERYICQFLIPNNFIKQKNGKEESPSLKIYNEYLKEFRQEDSVDIANAKRIKTIATLKDFIKYLTYRSNGAPRKISSLFEQYLHPFTPKDLNDPEYIIYANNSQSLCLRFGYYDQYKFSFISYLVTPIFLSIGNYMTDYSDKLLVSISYMLDHLLKHHKYGLSYRSLSLTPEIIDVNKEPEFRNFLDKLIGFLSKSHLRRIVSGIYDYKFQSKIASELKLLSKIDEHEAAAFNFTLDESIELKRHFRKKIKYLEEKYNTENINININNDQSQEYKNAVSLLYMHLGDLHFNDEEFGDAIEHYLEAIQIIRQKDTKKMHIYDFIVFVRNKLKLGLAFEKNKNFDSAQMTYAELTDLIIRKRNIPLRKIGLCRFYLKNNPNELAYFQRKIGGFKDFDIEKYDTYSKKGEEEFIIIGRPNKNLLKTLKKDDDWKKVYPLIDMDTFYAFNADDIAKNYKELPANFKPNKVNYEFTTFENIRILYQPIIAKLHLIEKSSPNKLKDIDVVRSLNEFIFYKKPLHTNQKRVIVAEFYNKVGDLLYFKNGTINTALKKHLLYKVEKNSCKESKILLSSPIDATVFYTKSLAVLLLSDYIKKNKHETICPEYECNNKTIEKIDILSYYNFLKCYDGLNHNKINDFKSFFKNVQKTIDQIISKLEGLHGSETHQVAYSNEYLHSIANGTIDLAGSLISFTKDVVLLNTDDCLNKCINLYYHANLIYKRIGEHRLAKSQLIKILHILLEKSSSTEINLKFNKDANSRAIEDLVNTCINYIYRTYDQANRPEVKKVREMFGIPSDNFPTIYGNTTITAEINEVIYLYWLLYYRALNKDNNLKSLFERPNEMDIKKVLDFSYKNTTPFSTINNKYNRMLELSLRLKVNKYLHDQNCLDYFIILLKEYLFKTKKTSDNDFCSISKQFIIIDSIGSCFEIIKTHDLYDANYITTNNLTLAKSHKLMGDWCIKLEVIKKNDIEQYEIIEKGLINILNTENLMYLNSHYHYDLANQYNYKVINFHNRGYALQDFLLNASYLDDFYNDNIVHFSITVERNHLNFKDIEKRIDDIDMESKGAEIKKLENYFYK